MDEVARAGSGDHHEPGNISLTGFYFIGAMANVLGLGIVIVLNLSTPLNFFIDHFAELSGLEIAGHILWAVLISNLSLFLAIYLILRPVSVYLKQIKYNKDIPAGLAESARRRLLNLPVILIPVNVCIWFLVPIMIFFSPFLFEHFGYRTALILAIRASMVGLVSSAIVFFGIESHSRRLLIPFFFPKGHLSDLNGVARISISRRIRMLYRSVSMMPMTILIVSLITMQWELDNKIISAEDFARGITFFSLVLVIVFYITSGVINRMVSSSIVKPLRDMLALISKVQEGDFNTRIQVTSNDEIGLLGDAGNTMIKGLAEREMIRATFGRYVTPEIRDEILTGRIPLHGERREATVLFADLRGFTSFVEINQPEEVISTLRNYFTAMHQAIRQYKGLILQFVGDEIEAVFGVPGRLENHADAAVQAAIEMDKALDSLNHQRFLQGKSAMAHGIGIHTGSVLAGNSGSEEQSAYTLIGDTVNIASRIQDLTKELGCDILASHKTVELLKKSYQMDRATPRWVKGYSKPITVYRIYYDI